MTRMVPMIPVRSVATSIEFYRKLGFEVLDRNDHWGWAMLRADDCRLMLDQSINTDPAAKRLGVLYLYPEDVLAFHRGCRERGLDLPAPEQTFYGMLELRVDDPDGNRLWIGQPNPPKPSA